MAARTVIIDGKPHAWRELVALRQAQAPPKPQQPTLFPLVDDPRPKPQRKAAGRYAEPTLFDAAPAPAPAPAGRVPVTDEDRAILTARCDPRKHGIYFRRYLESLNL